MNSGHYTGFRLKGAIVAMTYILLGISALSGCKDSTNTNNTSKADANRSSSPTAQEPFSLNSLLNSIEGATSNVQDAVGPHADAVQARTKDEVEKLFRWEYKVVDVGSQLQSAEFESVLASLGAEGWECFSIIPTAETTRVSCKRRPRSALAYLKYIPGL